MTTNENQTEENAQEQLMENRSKLFRAQFTRPALLFKAKLPKFSAGIKI